MNKNASVTLTNEVINKIRPLHGVNCAPYEISNRRKQQLIQSTFCYCGIPYSRLHDCCGSYGGTYFVDVPNIFRNFDADENCPENYDFHYTDEYIASIIEAGAQIVYRLGVTIEWGSKKYTSNPPKDFEKWARICEHIIKHYNCGWNNGFHYDIQYWEIWNEPENPPMWSGTREQFYNLYEISSKYLKSKFPDIKIGGYGSCGFYAAFRDGLSDFYKSFLPYFEDFLIMCRQKDCPLDFFTWHIYTSDISEIEKSQKYVKEMLNKYGFDKTESHLNEWNYGSEGGGFDKMDTMTGAAFCTSALISMQQCGIDLSQYYCLSTRSSYNGFMNLRTHDLTSTAYVFAAFNKLLYAENETRVISDTESIRVLSSFDGQALVFLISNYNNDNNNLNLNLEHFNDMAIQLYHLTPNGFRVIQEDVIKDSLTIDCATDSVFYGIVSRPDSDSFLKFAL